MRRMWRSVTPPARSRHGLPWHDFLRTAIISSSIVPDTVVLGSKTLRTAYRALERGPAGMHFLPRRRRQVQLRSLVGRCGHRSGGGRSRNAGYPPSHRTHLRRPIDGSLSGNRSLDENPDGITLQFLKHFKVVQTVLDPDDYSQKIQADADALDDETRRATAKHPDQKEARQQRLQEYQKSVDELIEFLGTKSLRAMHLDRAPLRK